MKSFREFKKINKIKRLCTRLPKVAEYTKQLLYIFNKL